jgi:hypothetical protein
VLLVLLFAVAFVLVEVVPLVVLVGVIVADAVVLVGVGVYLGLDYLFFHDLLGFFVFVLVVILVKDVHDLFALFL